MGGRRSLCFLLLASLPAFLTAACDDPSRPLDPRVSHLKQWIAFRPRAGGLFFLDRFETREEDVRLVAPEILAGQASSEADLPVVSMDLLSLVKVAKAYWARMPRLDEWQYALRGDNNWRYPWGDRYTSLLNANTFELRLHKRTRVGTFESGRDPSRDSCYDLIGNVAEWTLSPMLVLELPEELADLRRLAKKSGSPPPDPFHIGIYYFDMDEVLAAHGLPSSPWIWSWATPFVPELCQALWEDRLELCTVGFSFNRFLKQSRHLLPSEKIGVLGMSAASHASDLGMRMASDPYTMLAGLEETEGEPSEQDRVELAKFLLRFTDEFRRAARLRQSLDRDRLSLGKVGAWGRACLEILGVR